MSEYAALAKNVVRRSLRVRPGESVIVECWNHGLDAAKDIVYELRSAGARPLWILEDEETYWRGVETLPRTKLGRVSASEWAALSEADGYVFLPGPADIARYRKDLPRSAAATAYNSEWYRRARKARLRGVRVLLGYVTRERAAAYGFDYAAWRSMMLDASSVDPAAIARKGRRVAEILSRAADVEITSPNGTRLTLALKGRPARTDDGIVDEEDLRRGENMTNVPPGSAYVVPDEGSAEGTVVADTPEPYLGMLARGVRMEFRGGRAAWTVEAGGEHLRETFARAKGPKDRIGGISIGLNPNARYGFLQDDLVSGNVLVWIGDNTESGGRNRTDFSLSARLTRATLRVGRKTLVDAGRLAV